MPASQEGAGGQASRGPGRCRQIFAGLLPAEDANGPEDLGSKAGSSWLFWRGQLPTESLQDGSGLGGRGLALARGMQARFKSAPSKMQAAGPTSVRTVASLN